MSKNKNKSAVLLAEFDNPHELLNAARKIRQAGYNKFDCHSPFPIHGMDAAMGLRRSPLGFIVAIVSFTAMIGGLALQWWTNAVDYRFVIAGKPFVSYQAYAPVGFSITVFFAALTAFLGMLALNKLPQLFHPVFHSDRFQNVSDDAFFISIDASDPEFDQEDTKKFVESTGGKNVEIFEGEG